jgi:hypothetical protein
MRVPAAGADQRIAVSGTLDSASGQVLWQGLWQTARVCQSAQNGYHIKWPGDSLWSSTALYAVDG